MKFKISFWALLIGFSLSCTAEPVLRGMSEEGDAILDNSQVTLEADIAEFIREKNKVTAVTLKEQQKEQILKSKKTILDSTEAAIKGDGEKQVAIASAYYMLSKLDKSSKRAYCQKQSFLWANEAGKTESEYNINRLIILSSLYHIGIKGMLPKSAEISQQYADDVINQGTADDIEKLLYFALFWEDSLPIDVKIAAEQLKKIERKSSFLSTVLYGFYSGTTKLENFNPLYPLTQKHLNKIRAEFPIDLAVADKVEHQLLESTKDGETEPSYYAMSMLYLNSDIGDYNNLFKPISNEKRACFWLKKESENNEGYVRFEFKSLNCQSKL